MLSLKKIIWKFNPYFNITILHFVTFLFLEQVPTITIYYYINDNEVGWDICNTKAHVPRILLHFFFPSVSGLNWCYWVMEGDMESIALTIPKELAMLIEQISSFDRRKSLISLKRKNVPTSIFLVSHGEQLGYKKT